MLQVLRGACVAALLAGVAACAGPADDAAPRVVLETALGNITVEVYPDRAPASAGSFLAFVDTGLYEGATFYRTVRRDNDRGEPVIEVIQGGLTGDDEPLPPVPHESTKDTGLRHTDGTVSLARADPGTASGAAFFICIGDQPALDFGGARNADGLGFAAIGRVVEGMDVVHAIHASPANAPTDFAYFEGQLLTEPVRIVAARRLH